MHAGKLVFAQLMDHLPRHTFRRCVARYYGDHKVKTFTCMDQYLCMAFAQLTYRESLRDIEACLRAQQHKLYHMGIGAQVSREPRSPTPMRRAIGASCSSSSINHLISVSTKPAAGQILSVTPFEKTPVDKTFFDASYKSNLPDANNQLTLFH